MQPDIGEKIAMNLYKVIFDTEINNPLMSSIIEGYNYDIFISN